MLEFFREGGIGMLPVLVFGLGFIVVSGLYARDCAAPRLQVIRSLAALLLVTMTHAMLLNVAAVFQYLSDAERAPDAEFSRLLVTGLMESTRPGVLGGAFLVFGLVLVTIGAQRSAARALALGDNL